MTNKAPQWSICSDGTGEIDYGSKVLFFTFDHYIDHDSFDGHGNFRNIEITILEASWGLENGDLIENIKLNTRNKERMIAKIKQDIYSDFEKWGCDDLEWDRSDEPNDLNTLYCGCW